MSDVEDRARAMGWVSQDEFKGDPDKWRPAEEFVERGEKIMPILQERLGKMEQMLADKSEKLERVTENLSKFAEFHKGTYKRAYEKAEKRIKAAIAEAEEAGDFEGYRSALEEQKALEQEKQALEVGEAVGGQQPVPEFHDFQKANPWYGKDLAMTVYVDALAPGIAQNVSSDVEFYAKIEQAARAEFPHKFTSAAHNTVEGGGDGGSGEGSKTKKSWRDLPKEAREAYEINFASIPGFSREDYAKDFFAQE